jgi:hypothetical protein
MSMDVIKTEPDSAVSGDEMADDNGEQDPLSVSLPEAEVSSTEKVLQTRKKALVSL